MRMRSITTITVLALLGCGNNDAPTPTSPSVLGEASRALDNGADNSPWESIDADVQISASDAGGHARSSVMHVRRVRLGGGWSTTITLPPRLAASYQVSDPSIGIGRIEYDSHGAIKAFTRDGRQVPMPTPEEQLAKAPASVRARVAAIGQRGSSAAGTSGMASPVDHAFASRAGYSALSTKLRERFGAPRPGVKGRERFTRQVGDTVLTLTADPAVGGIVAVDVAAGSAKLVTMRADYVSMDDGNFYRRHVHLEQASIAGRKGRTFDIQLSNIVVSSKGGTHVVRNR